MTTYGWTTPARSRRRTLASLTPLNRRTSLKYQRCADNHRPSGETVTREFPQGPRVIPVCKRCRVPYTHIRRWGDGFSG